MSTELLTHIAKLKTNISADESVVKFIFSILI